MTIAVVATAGGGYDDLLKLDELKKKGIISHIEFEQQKAKILNSR